MIEGDQFGYEELIKPPDVPFGSLNWTLRKCQIVSEGES